MKHLTWLPTPVGSLLSKLASVQRHIDRTAHYPPGTPLLAEVRTVLDDERASLTDEINRLVRN